MSELGIPASGTVRLYIASRTSGPSGHDYAPEPPAPWNFNVATGAVVPAAPVAGGASDRRCARLSRVIRRTTARIRAALRVRDNADTAEERRAATKRLRALVVKREGYRIAFRVVCER